MIDEQVGHPPELRWMAEAGTEVECIEWRLALDETSIKSLHGQEKEGVE